VPVDTLVQEAMPDGYRGRVFAVYDTTGEWDSFMVARFKSVRDLDSFVKRVLALPDVERTNTSVVLNTVKEELRVTV